MLAILLLLALILVPPPTEAQQVAKPWRVGVLSAGFADRPPPKAFRTALRELGYVEGQNLVLESRYAEGKFERLPQLALELVKLGPDVIVAVAGTEVLAVKRATTTIPIVTVVMLDPIAMGLVTNLGRPGGNITGLTSTTGPELHGKRLQLPRELVPGAIRIALLWNPGTGLVTGGRVSATEAAARTLGLHVRVVEVQTRDDLRGAFAMLKQHRIQALLVPADALFNRLRDRLVELGAETRMPVMYDLPEFVEAGGLAAYGPSYIDLFSRAAGYVDKILKGANPGDLPIEQPTKFELVINLKTAKALGITIPQSLRLRADRVIE